METNRPAPSSDKIAKGLFALSALMLAFLYGVGATHYGLFPVPLMKTAKTTIDQLLEESGAALPWYYQLSDETVAAHLHSPGATAPGLRLVSGLGPNERTQVKVIDVNGRTIHSWDIDWFQIWPNPDHLAEELRPKSNAGLVHGLAMTPNGDLVFNFSELGLVRLDPCGSVVWKVPYRTHHSVNVDDAGNIWAAGLITRNEARPDLPNYAPPFDDFTILEVSPDGKILQELPVIDLLLENKLAGLLYLSSIRNRSTTVTGDTLHLNDIEIFPKSMTPGFFSHGDVMISLRNINALVVFDPHIRRVKFLSIGAVLRQHDPDFLDGNTISVFDNNNLAIWDEETTPKPNGHHSRVVAISAPSNDVSVRFSGTTEQPFFTDIMGSHQILPNGNILLMESIAGRVVEVDNTGRMIWEYFNLVGNKRVALLDDAFVLAPEYDERFFAKAVSTCERTSRN